jgi:hypothetical protein
MAITILVSFMIGYLIGSPNVFSVGNPFSVVRGMIQLNVSDENIIQISSNPKRYVSRVKDGNYPLIEMIEVDGWKFQENRGIDNGYGPVFLKENDWKIVKDIQYTRKYRVWEVVD